MPQAIDAAKADYVSKYVALAKREALDLWETRRQEREGSLNAAATVVQCLARSHAARRRVRVRARNTYERVESATMGSACVHPR